MEGETRGSDGDTPGNYTPDTHLVYLAMRNRWVKLGLAAGISVAIYPILFLWTDLIGLHLGALYAWIPPLAGAVLLLWKYVKAWHQGALKLRLPGIQLADAELLFVLGLVILTRFWVIRSLPLPMWGDSYQHTMMAQLLVDNGGLFNSWKPYAELTTFTYHFGFHSLVAIFHWITQLSLPQSTLWVGQILNILAVIVIYPLAMLIFNNHWSGVVALLVAGLLSPMPMFYVNWGRYTQLAGQVILPVAMWFAWAHIASKRTNWRVLGPGWLIWGALALTHYRVLLFGATFIPALLLLQLKNRRLVPAIKRTFWLGLGAGIIALPWYIHIFAGKLFAIFAAHMSTPPQKSSSFARNYNGMGNLFNYLPPFIWVALIFSIIWLLWKCNLKASVISSWYLLILFAANPQWLHLPGSGVLTNFAVFIASYIPVSILIGIPLGEIIQNTISAKSGDSKNDSLSHIFTSFVIVILIAGAGVWAAKSRLDDLDAHKHALGTYPDLQASSWIRENTPPDARFLVNSLPAYGGSSIVGSDGGWWLPLLTNRQTTLPPLVYVAEAGPIPNYRLWINALTEKINSKGITDPEVLAMLTNRGVSHVYIGQRQGKVNNGVGIVLEPELLLFDPHFDLLYHQDRVWIFEYHPDK